MTGQLNIANNSIHSDDLRRVAETNHLLHSESKARVNGAESQVVIRVARLDDGPALRRLAQVDSARHLEPDSVLVAESGGELLAAHSIDSGYSIANPFRQTAHLVEALSERASQLRGEQVRGDGRLRRIWNAVRGGATQPAMAPLAGDVSMPIHQDGE